MPWNDVIAMIKRLAREAGRGIDIEYVADHLGHKNI
jgi:hypothetical protein